MASKDRKKAMGIPGIDCIRQNGCKAAFVRKVVSSLFVYHPDKARDPGFRQWHNGWLVHSGCTAKSKAACNENIFFLTKMCDQLHYGGNCANYGLVEQSRQWGGPHCYPTKAITCPTFIYHGKEEQAVPPVHAEHLHKLISGSELVVMNDHGHGSIGIEYENIILALVQGKSATGTFGNSSSFN